MIGQHPDPGFLIRQFLDIPYENISKIFQLPLGKHEQPRQLEQLYKEYKSRGWGGTCFSLANAAIQLLRKNKISAWPIQGEMQRRTFPHFALAGEYKGRIFFSDPGYLIYDAVILDDKTGAVYSNGVMDYEIRVREDGRFSLVSIEQNGVKERYSFSVNAVDDDWFADSWKQSFSNIKNIVVSRIVGDQFIYVNGDYVQIRTKNNQQKMESPVLARQHLLKYFPFTADELDRAAQILAHK